MLHVLYVLEANIGGARRHRRDLVAGGAAAGHRVTVVLSFGRDPLAHEEDLPFYSRFGVRVVELPMRRAISPFADLTAWWKLRSLIRREKPDIVHAHSSKAGALARLACAGSGIPVVYTPHVFPFLMQDASPLYRHFERRAIARTAAVVCVTRQEAEAAVQLGYPSERVAHIPNGIDPSEAAEPETERLSKAAFFGRECPQKGTDWLRETGIECDFHTAYRPGEALAWMRRYSLILMPSRWEGCPYTLLEAWAAGTPVAATPVGGLAEMIRDGENGILLPMDAECWRCEIPRLLADRNQLRRLARNAREDLSSYTLNTMRDQTLALYQRVHSNPRLKISRR